MALRILDGRKPDASQILEDFKNCLSDYRQWGDNFWTGWALGVDQTFNVGNEVRTTERITKRVQLKLTRPAQWSVISL